ncbi:MAG: 1,4-beta-D-glucan glucohydrolase [Hydrocarboniphaga sp.]|uniref:glycoside hydrolase family 3 protein n=1 Tax=Hydrocarboniphaga sp. TaxID=2033016 RepID=UPI002618932F|nr:exo 1,3/1,4-beta-D-glucan glucohydrolase [Hydrocarboniphaga sp.]MDB5972476.1 1,4-beta-D-glucan glucohydrolase [Hydrocarboniphaga sp.]
MALVRKRWFFISGLLIAGGLGSVAASPADVAVHPALWPDSPAAQLATPAVEARVDALLASMPLEQKVGQMIQGDISTITPQDLHDYPLGSVLAGGNSGPGGDDRAPPAAWLAMADAYYTAAMDVAPGRTPIPLLFGVDAVHGHNNIIGATLFPHNVGLGATRDPELLHRIAEATAKEVAVTGLDWSFAPTLAVVRDDRWGRSYESYSEEPEVVRSYAAAVVSGLQGDYGTAGFMGPGRTLASAKHFLGDGGTDGGHDQGNNLASEAELIRLHNAGYPPALEAGVLTVMASFSSWQGQKLSGSEPLITQVLKQRMGFQGLVVSDWNAHSQIPGCTKDSCAAVFNAGVDMVMAADCWKGLYTHTLAQARSGQIPAARIDDAVRRILRVKLLAGLFEKPRPSQRPLAGDYAELGSPAHRALAREAARRSLVLLKNNGGLLPLQRKARVLVAGTAADDIGRQTGGWTISWQGTGNGRQDFPGATSIWQGIRELVEHAGGSAELSADGHYTHKPDAAIVVFGEEPYAEFQGDLETLEYQAGDKRDLALLRRLKRQGIPVVSIFLSGRPLWVNPEINASRAFVAAWLPGSEGAAIADLIFRAPAGRAAPDFSGKLPFSWPRSAAQTLLNRGDAGYAPLFAYGYGLSYRDHGSLRRLSEDPGVAAPTAANLGIYFRKGRTLAPWALYARDSQGAAALDAATLASPGRVLQVRAVDGAAQEDARSISWSGGGDASIYVQGKAVDLRRQANGDMVLSLRYRVDRAPSAPVRLRLSCGEGCGASLDAGSLFGDAAGGAWRTAHIKLSCFAAAGADLSQVERPFEIQTDGRFGLSFTELKLDSNPGDGSCPGS